MSNTEIAESIRDIATLLKEKYDGYDSVVYKRLTALAGAIEFDKEPDEDDNQ